MHLIILALLVLTVLVIDYIFHLYHKKKFQKYLPKNILNPLDETIELPTIEESKDINKTIYRTYYDLSFKSSFQKAIDATQKNMPYYEQVYYDDDDIEDFIRIHYSERILKAYLSINSDYGPARADFFRYLIIYKYGGIYLDIKSSIVKDIREEIEKYPNHLFTSKGRDKIIDYPNNFGILPVLRNNYNWSDFSGIKYGEYNNWHIIAPAGHPVLGKMIQQIVSNIELGLKEKDMYNHGEYSVLALTGPLLYTKIIEKYKDNNVMIKESSFDNKLRYRFFDHNNIGSKKHYSQNKNKQVLVWQV